MELIKFAHLRRHHISSSDSPLAILFALKLTISSPKPGGRKVISRHRSRSSRPTWLNRRVELHATGVVASGHHEAAGCSLRVQRRGGDAEPWAPLWGSTTSCNCGVPKTLSLEPWTKKPRGLHFGYISRNLLQMGVRSGRFQAGGCVPTSSAAQPAGPGKCAHRGAGSAEGLRGRVRGGALEGRQRTLLGARGGNRASRSQLGRNPPSPRVSEKNFRDNRQARAPRAGAECVDSPPRRTL